MRLLHVVSANVDIVPSVTDTPVVVASITVSAAVMVYMKPLPTEMDLLRMVWKACLGVMSVGEEEDEYATYDLSVATYQLPLVVDESRHDTKCHPVRHEVSLMEP